MPEHITRAMWFIADAGKFPQDKQYTLTSARNTKTENIGSDKRSLFYLTPHKVIPVQGGFLPDLTLSYSSNDSNRVVDIGWNLSLPVATKKTANQLPQCKERF